MNPITLIVIAIWLVGILLFLSAIFGVIFWIWMIIDCAKRAFKSETDKIVWLLIIIFLHAIGAFIYYFAVKRAKK